MKHLLFAVLGLILWNAQIGSEVLTIRMDEKSGHTWVLLKSQDGVLTWLDVGGELKQHPWYGEAGFNPAPGTPDWAKPKE